MRERYEPTTRFSNRVDAYVTSRPSYPPAVIDLLRRECGLSASSTVADVGSGPGNLTRLFLATGIAVLGVEPNREMREAGEHLMSADPRFTSVAGSAEETTLAAGSVDLVAAGQAFHWFDRELSRTEFARILREPRWVALIWNDRRAASTPFLASYEGLLQEYGTDYAELRLSYAADASGPDAFFGSRGYRLATFENGQTLGLEGLIQRVLSTSYAPPAGHPRHDAMLRDLRALFDTHQHDGTVVIDYETRVYYGCL